LSLHGGGVYAHPKHATPESLFFLLIWSLTPASLHVHNWCLDEYIVSVPEVPVFFFRLFAKLSPAGRSSTHSATRAAVGSSYALMVLRLPHRPLLARALGTDSFFLPFRRSSFNCDNASSAALRLEHPRCQEIPRRLPAFPLSPFGRRNQEKSSTKQRPIRYECPMLTPPGRVS